MRKKRLKIIPDRVFHKLWNAVDDYDLSDQYVSSLSTDTSIFNYDAYGITYQECLYLLRELYEAKNMSFKDLLEAAGAKKSDISHIFCIPIRTIEDWYSGKNRTPSYIKLMILRQFHMLDLGKYIRLASSVEYIRTQPSIYIKRYSSTDRVNGSDPIGQLPVSAESDAGPVKDADYYYDEFMSGAEYEKYLDRLIAESKNRRH